MTYEVQSRVDPTRTKQTSWSHEMNILRLIYRRIIKPEAAKTMQYYIHYEHRKNQNRNIE